MPMVRNSMCGKVIAEARGTKGLSENELLPGAGNPEKSGEVPFLLLSEMPTALQKVPTETWQ